MEESSERSERRKPRVSGEHSAERSEVYVLLDPKAWQAVGKVEKWYEGYYGPEWLHHMHKMIDALAKGHTLEAYIQSVLDKARAREA